MALRSVAAVVGLVAVLHQVVPDVVYPLRFFVLNHPYIQKPVNEFSKHTVKWPNEVRNCEDVVLDETTGTAIFSCDPGRDLWNTVMGVFISPTEKTGWLNYYQYADGSSQGTIRPLDIKGLDDVKKATFHPLGLNFWPETRTLYVVNHGEHPPPIEVFTLSDDATTLTYERSVTHELIRTPNSIQPISDHEIYFSNDHHYEVREQPVLAKLETFLHIAKGNVVYFNLKTNEGKQVAELPFANGVAQLNNTHLAVASSTGLAVHIYEIQPDHSLVQRQRLLVDFWVDNLRVDSEGKLLITGHPYALLLERVAKNQHKYNLDHGRRDGLDPGQRPRAGSRVDEWDGNAEGKIKTLFLDTTGEVYGVSTTTTRDARRGIGFVVGLYEKGILQFEP